ncbi:MAG: hypothetical protein R3B13_09640 [Polyangiaceae bacterium]
MKHEPIRWLDAESDASDLERSLLRGHRESPPPRGAKEQVWSGILAHLPPGGPGGGPGSGGEGVATVGSAGALSLAKSALIGIAAGVAISAGVGTALQPSPKPVSAAALPVSTATALAPKAVATFAPVGEFTPPEPAIAPARQADVRAPAVRAASTDSTTPVATSIPEAASPQSRASSLADEARMLRNARAALGQKRPDDALGWLSQATRKYPRSTLGQEREALTIEALALKGDREAARRRAEQFAASNPDSPHRERVLSITNSR